MDLYRVLRLSIYLVATTGGWAIAQVEGSPTCFLAVAASAAIAWVTVDAGRIRPIRPALSAAFGIALLVHYLVSPVLSGESAFSIDAQRMMHFLCALQIMLFFTTFRGSLIFTFCGANLFIVIVSGKLDSDVSLLLRLTLFLSATTWLLFIHALWLERQKFETRQSMPGPPGLSRVTSRDRLSERAFWQGLRMTSYVTLSCLITGFMLFFVWPRATFGALSNWIQQTPNTSENGIVDSGLAPPVGGAPEVSRTGAGETVNLNGLGPVHQDSSEALLLVLDCEASQVTGPSGAIYLRDRVMSEYGKDGKWKTPALAAPLTAQPGSEWVVLNRIEPRFLEPLGHREVVGQTIRPSRSLVARACFALAPVRQIGRKRIDMDEEGALLLTDNQRLNTLTSITVWSNRPVKSTELRPDARTRDPEPSLRYLRWRDAFRGADVEIKFLADQLTGSTTTDLGRINALLEYLKSGRFKYTMELNRRTATERNPLAEFLLSTDTAQRQGHCGFFASAFVILARASGLPARLATGFAHTVLPGEEARKQVQFQNSDAHAWAEVFFESYGWVAFDPTFGVPQAEPSKRDAVKPSNTVPLGDGPGLTPVDSGLLNRGWTYFMNYTRDDQKRLYTQIGDKLDHATNVAERVLSFGSDWSGFGVAVIWLLVLGTSLVVFLFFWRQKGKRRAGPSHLPRSARAAVTFYQELLQVLSRRGFMRRPGQTPREFAALVVRRGGDTYLPALVVTQVFERVRYGGEEPTSAELEDLRAAMEFLCRSGDLKKQ